MFLLPHFQTFKCTEGSLSPLAQSVDLYIFSTDCQHFFCDIFNFCGNKHKCHIDFFPLNSLLLNYLLRLRTSDIRALRCSEVKLKKTNIPLLLLFVATCKDTLKDLEESIPLDTHVNPCSSACVTHQTGVVVS